MGKVTEWATRLKLAEQSQREYVRECERYEEWARERKLRAVQAQTLLAYRQWRLLDDKPATLNRRMAILKSAFEEGWRAQEQDRLQVDQLGDLYVEHDRSRPQRVTAGSDDSVVEGEEAIRPLLGWAPSILREYRDVALIAYLRSSGLPLTAALRLRTEEVTAGEVRVVGGKTLALETATLARIQEWLKLRHVPSPWVFTAFNGRGRLSSRAMSRVAAWRVVSRRAKEVGVYVTPRLLRSQRLYDLASDDSTISTQAWEVYLTPRTLSRYRNLVRKRE